MTGAMSGASPGGCAGAGSPAALPSFDVGKLILNLNSAFNPLHHDCLVDYHIARVGNGYVHLTFALPEGMTRVFITLLESLSGLFRIIDTKTRSVKAQGREIDLAERERVETAQTDFVDQACSLYDKFIEDRHPMNDAVKLTNSALKAMNHPWATYEVVLNTLRKAGKLRKLRPRI